MAKSQGSDSLWSELLIARLYKRNQGRLVRQLTALAAAVIILFAAWSLSQGPLSDFNNAAYVLEVRYSGGSEQSLESSLKELAAEHQGVTASAENVGGGGQRSLSFRWPTSRFWSVDSELQKEMNESVQQFRAAVEEQYGNRVSISEPDHRVRESFVFETAIPLLISALGIWFSFRLVNWPRFADFLISVEAEMDKVSWPTRRELWRSSTVVLATMFLLGVVLFVYDIFWQWLFRLTNLLQI